MCLLVYQFPNLICALKKPVETSATNFVFFDVDRWITENGNVNNCSSEGENSEQ